MKAVALCTFTSGWVVVYRNVPQAEGCSALRRICRDGHFWNVARAEKARGSGNLGQAAEALSGLQRRLTSFIPPPRRSRGGGR